MMRYFVLFALIATTYAKSSSPGNVSKAVLGTLPLESPQNVIVRRTNDSMCIKTLQPINSTDHAMCNWNCAACANNCVNAGFSYYCCEDQWCCCYAYQGNCAQNGVNCWENGCPH